MFRLFILTLCSLIIASGSAFAESIAYKKRFSDGTIHRYFQYAYYPRHCEKIFEIESSPQQYVVRNMEIMSSISRKCMLYDAGRTIKEGKDKALGFGKKIFEESGVGSFFRGLTGD